MSDIDSFRFLFVFVEPAMNQTVDQRGFANGAVADENQLGLVERAPTAARSEIVVQDALGLGGTLAALRPSTSDLKTSSREGPSTSRGNSSAGLS